MCEHIKSSAIQLEKITPQTQQPEVGLFPPPPLPRYSERFVMVVFKTVINTFT